MTDHDLRITVPRGRSLDLELGDLINVEYEDTPRQYRLFRTIETVGDTGPMVLEHFDFVQVQNDPS